MFTVQTNSIFAHPVEFASLADAALCCYARRRNEPVQTHSVLDVDGYIVPSNELAAAVATKNDRPMSIPCARTRSTKAQFANMTVAELQKRANEWNEDRKERAARQFAGYQLVDDEGTLLNLDSGEVYRCEDVRRWPALPGQVAFIGCDCPDEETRCRPLREEMASRPCGAPCYCKHHYVRLLLSGGVLHVRNCIVRARRK